MNTLLIQLIAPMQSWGVQSLHDERETGLEPSKSGVVGLLCAALGRDRSESIEDLSALRMGVRVDREGRLLSDFHKVEPLDAMGCLAKKEGACVSIGHRYYLSDAAFLVGLEGELNLLEMLQAALLQPVYLLFLGRKAFPPAAPVWLRDGLKTGVPLRQALQTYPTIVSNAPGRRRVILEDPLGEIIVNDQPVSFLERRFGPRGVHIEYWNPMEEIPCSSHN